MKVFFSNPLKKNEKVAPTEEKIEKKVPEIITEVDEDSVKDIKISVPINNPVSSATPENIPTTKTVKTTFVIENESSKPDGSVKIEASQYSEVVSHSVNNEVALVSNKTKQAQAGVVSQELLQSRAKTVRIGRVRWPPPLNPNETFESELQR